MKSKVNKGAAYAALLLVVLSTKFSTKLICFSRIESFYVVKCGVICVAT